MGNAALLRLQNDSKALSQQEVERKKEIEQPSIISEKDDLPQDVKPKKAIHITGAVGKFACQINSSFVETDQMHNDRILYKSFSSQNHWLRYTVDGRWIVSDTEDKDENLLGGICYCEAFGLLDPSMAKRWFVLKEQSVFQNQTRVVATKTSVQMSRTKGKEPTKERTEVPQDGTEATACCRADCGMTDSPNPCDAKLTDSPKSLLAEPGVTVTRFDGKETDSAQKARQLSLDIVRRPSLRSDMMASVDIARRPSFRSGMMDVRKSSGTRFDGQKTNSPRKARRPSLDTTRRPSLRSGMLDVEKSSSFTLSDVKKTDSMRKVIRRASLDINRRPSFKSDTMDFPNLTKSSSALFNGKKTDSVRKGRRSPLNMLGIGRRTSCNFDMMDLEKSSLTLFGGKETDFARKGRRPSLDMLDINRRPSFASDMMDVGKHSFSSRPALNISTTPSILSTTVININKTPKSSYRTALERMQQTKTKKITILPSIERPKISMLNTK